LWDDTFPSAEGDGVGYVAHVGFEAGGDVDGSQSFLKMGDFKATGGDLLAELLLPCVGGVELLASGQGAVVDGGDESIGNGMDGFINVWVSAQKDFHGSRGYWGEFLLSFASGSREAERRGVFIVGDDNMG